MALLPDLLRGHHTRAVLAGTAALRRDGHRQSNSAGGLRRGARDFLRPICDSLIEESPFKQACPLPGPGARVLSLARKAKDCD